MADFSLADILSRGNADDLERLKPYLRQQPAPEAPKDANFYKDLLQKQVGQDVVDSQALPGKSAAESAEVLQGAPSRVPQDFSALNKVHAEDLVNQQSLPGKSAMESAETLVPKQLPVPSGTRMSGAAGRAASAAEGAVGDGTIELAGDQWRNLPALIENKGLQLAQKGGVPDLTASAKAAAQAAASDGGAEGLGSLAGIGGDVLGAAGRFAGPAAIAYEALKSTPTAASEPSGISPKGMPNKQFAGEDIIDKTPLPNGGMSQAAAIAQNPGPPASTGFNPNAVVPQDPEKKRLVDLVARSKGRAPAVAPSDSVATSQAAPTGAPAPTLADFIAKMTGGQDEQLRQAQMMSGIMHGMNQISRGSAIAGAGVNAPNAAILGAINENDKNADAPVNNVLAQHKAMADKLAQRKQVTDLFTDSQMSDAGSDISKAYRDAAAKFSGKPIPANMSAAQLKALDPIYEKMYASDQNAKNRANALEVARINKDAALGARATDKQNAAKLNAIKMADSFRGSAAAKQADIDIYNANKAQSLANLYGDPSKLTPQQAGLFAIEVAKIAKGGTPDHQEFNLLQNPDLRSKLSGTIQSFTGTPTPANAAKFIKQYSDYVDKIKQDAYQVKHDKVIKPINSLRRDMGEDNFNDVKQSYIDPIEADMKPQSAQVFGKDVLDYAKKYNISPQEAQSYKDNYKEGK